LHSRYTNMGLSDSRLSCRGMSVEEILAEYPQLGEEDVRAAIAYGAEMSRSRYVELLVEAA
jgi:uncharacterized protein (DUF433 family)